MAIDIRATVTCSLGHPILSGSISDDYLQGSGLIKTRGSVEVSALITPDIGTTVTFSYVKGGVTRSIPRKLRVMSSFADPFRRTTKIELGCKLTYLSDLKDPIDWTAFSDPQNSGYTAADAAIVTLPIYASSVINKCLAQLGILASSNPLTNRFSIPEFDFSAGYVSVLSDLLVSESYFGYLDLNEVLQVQSLDVTGGSGPVFTSADIVDLGSIGVGQLPGESVTVSYSSLVLRAPTQEDGGGIETPVTEEEIEEQERINWESISTVGAPQTYVVSYTNLAGVNTSQTYTGITSSKTTTTYKTLTIKKTDIAESEGIDTQLVFIGSTTSLSAGEQAAFLVNPVAVLDANWPSAEPYEYVSHPPTLSRWVYIGDTWQKQATFPDAQDLYTTKDVVSTRITEETGPLISVASSIAADYLANGEGFPAATILLKRTVETFQYDLIGNQTSSTSSTYEAAVAVVAAVAITWADSTGTVGYTTDLELTQQTIVTNDVFDDYTQETTSTSIKYAFTQVGQQAVAKSVEQAADLTDMSAIIDNVLASGLVSNGTSVTTSRRGVTMSQERPPAAARTNLKYASSADNSSVNPSDGYRTESSTNTVLALGSASAQRRIEFTLPYAPDDVFVGSSGGPFYRGNSDADAKAMTYGRVQNRLLLGNRSGINLQLSPERIPNAPFEPLYVQASGLTALYRANGTSWAFDSNGIVTSIDALFWGAVGGTGTFWFPVAPGITTLPTTPAIVDGAMNATTVVLPYNETAVYNGILRTRLDITRFGYSLTLLTEVNCPLTLINDFEKVTPIYMPAPTNFVVAAAAPTITNSFNLRISNVPNTSITTNIPAIPNSTDVRILTTPDFTIQTHIPQVGSGIGVVVAPPGTTITVAAPVPQVGAGIGTAIQPPATTVTVAAQTPTITTV